MYKRILLKLSGEALGADGRLFCHETIARVADAIKDVCMLGIQVGIVTGGGNIWRGRKDAPAGMDPVTADQIGMSSTLLNCLCLKDALLQRSVKAVILSAVFMDRFSEPYRFDQADAYLNEGVVTLFAFGSGHPFFSTDTAVVLRAAELRADAILMAKNIDGVYTADPRQDANARLMKDITYDECMSRDLHVMDQAAFALCKENRIPMIRVFALSQPENILKVLQGDDMGSYVHP